MTDMEKAENLIISYPQGTGLYSNILAKDVFSICELKSIAKALSQARSEGYRQGMEKMREECAKIADKQAIEWDSDDQITDKNYAGFCAFLIRSIQIGDGK